MAKWRVTETWITQKMVSEDGVTKEVSIRLHERGVPKFKRVERGDVVHVKLDTMGTVDSVYREPMNVHNFDLKWKPLSEGGLITSSEMNEAVKENIRHILSKSPYTLPPETETGDDDESDGDE